MPDRKADIPAAVPRLAVFAAAAWLIVFLVAFFNVEITDPEISRWRVWTLVPELLDFIDPPADPAALAGRAPVHSGWPYFEQRIDLLAVAAIILAGAWGMGCLSLRALRAPVPAGSLEHWLFVFGTGLSALSLVTLGAGLAGALSRPFLGGLIALSFLIELAFRYIPGLAGAGGGSRDGGSLKGNEGNQQRQGDKETGRQGKDIALDSAYAPSSSRLAPGHWIVLATLIPFLLATLLGACLPSTDFDVNEYHFQGPKEFFQAGRISFLEHNVYTSFPFGTEMLTLLAMVLEGDWYRGALAGKTLLMSFGPLTGLALFAAGRRWFGTTTGVLAATLYLSTPWIYRISTIAYAEGGICFYLFSSLLALMIGVDHLSAEASPGVHPGRGARSAAGVAEQTAGPHPDSLPEGERARPATLTPAASAASIRQIALCGLLAGSAMACKYPALVSVVIPALAVTIRLAMRQQGKFRWILPGIFLLGTLVTIGPWLAKNAVETGNPVYPLAYSLFGGRDWDAALDARWKKAHRPDTYSLSSLANLATEVAARSKWNNPLLFAFAPLALVAACSRRRAGWLWIYVGWLFLTCWLFTHRLDRFWVPMLPVVSLLAGVGAAWFWKALRHGLSGHAALQPAGSSGPPWSSRFDLLLGVSMVVLPFAGVALFNLEVVVSGLSGYNDYLRDLDEAALTAEHVTSPEILWLNRTLPPDRPSRVLSVGDAEMFYARFLAIYNTVFDQSIIEEWCGARPGAPAEAASLRDSTSIRQKFADEGITHVYVNWLEILRYRSPGNYGYTNFVTPELFAELQRQGILGRALETPGAMPVEDLSQAWHTEAESWGKALITRTADGPAFTTFQVFLVLPPGGR
jgi:4-amino-4-deoxy-L-arabinose transferase-like glycosyltransferase